MKKTLFVLALALQSLVVWAQENPEPTIPHITAKWAPTGLLLGSLSLQAEYNFGSRNSLTAKIGLPVNVKHSFDYDNEKLGFNLKATSFLAGYRTYFSKTKHLRGLYYEPFFNYVNHTSEGSGTLTLAYRPALFNFINNYSGVGVGIQLGAQFFIGKRFIIDLFFLGPEINSASNTFKAVEVTNTLRWTDVDARAAQNAIRDFLNEFPFIRNKTTVMVDKDMKRVRAAFKGAMPGVRTGFSIGIAF
jgi:hypothetical protein